MMMMMGFISFIFESSTANLRKRGMGALSLGVWEA
jgi:hypothetical protein